MNLHSFKSISNCLSKWSKGVLAVGALLLLTNELHAQSVTRVYTDYNGFWTSNSASNTVRPDNRHNLTAFELGGQVFSTGVNDASLIQNGVQFTEGDYRSMPIVSLPGNTQIAASENYLVMGENIDGTVNGPNYTAQNIQGLRATDVLIDGIKGLDIGTGVTNIRSGVQLVFSAVDLDFNSINDADPEIVISQIADPDGTTTDRFAFLDVNGNVVGSEIVVNFSTVASLGKYRMNLFSIPANTPYVSATVSGNGPNSTNTRDIRLLAFRFEDFGVDVSNYLDIRSLRYIAGGKSDPAFIAYNYNSFSLGAPAITTQPVSQIVCPGNQPVTFSVAADGLDLTYQWKFGGVNIPGATSSTYTINNVTPANYGQYAVQVSNANGIVQSQFVYLNSRIMSVTRSAATACLNTNFTVTALTEGVDTRYQWYRNTVNNTTTGTAISGATSAVLTRQEATTGNYFYYVKINSGDQACTEVTSSTVQVTINGATAGTITANRTMLCSGQNATLTLAGHSGTIRWQQSTNNTTWAFVSGTHTTATYTTAALTESTYFRALLTAACGTVSTASIFIEVPTGIVWTGAVDTDWYNPNNWLCGVVPTETSNVDVPTNTFNRNPQIGYNTGSCNNIRIRENAQVTVVTPGQFNVHGNMTDNGKCDATNGKVSFRGNSAQTLQANRFHQNAIKDFNSHNQSNVTCEGPLDIRGELTCSRGNFTTGNQVTLKSNSSYTAIVGKCEGTITGTMTVEQHIPGRRGFRFVTPTTNGGTIRENWQENGNNAPGFGTHITGQGGAANGFDPTATNNPGMYRYNNTQGSGWTTVTSTNTGCNAGDPYRLMVRGDRTVDMSTNTPTPTNTCLRSHGTIRQGDQNVTDLYQGTKGWSMIGNPYPAPVDFKQVLDESQSIGTNFFYVWDPTINTRGGYVTVNTVLNQNNVSGSVANNTLDRGCAAIVSVHGNQSQSPKMTFREDHKVSRSSTRANWRSIESTPNTTLRMTLFEANAYATQGPAADGFVILFDYNGFNGINEQDASKMTNLDETVGTYQDETIHAFETRQMPVEGEVIPLAHRQYRFANYVYVAEISSIAGVEAYLYDAFTGTSTPMPAGITAVPFTVDATNDASKAWNRFSIGFQNQALSAAEFNAASVNVYPNPYNGNSFTVGLSTQMDYQVTLFNAVGQSIPVRLESTAAGMQVTPHAPLATGVYMVQVSNGNTSFTKKLIVK